jgi:HemX protein
VRLLGAGVAILTVSLGVGSVYWLKDTTTVNLAKLLVTIAVWIAYTAALGFRLRGVLLANRFAWSCLVLYLAALVSIVVVDRSRHPIAQRAEVRSE